MITKIYNSARFVKTFLSKDNLNKLRNITLNESTDERKVVDLNLAGLVNSHEDVEAISRTKLKPAALIDGYNFLTGKTLFTCSPEEHFEYIKSFPLEIVGQKEWIKTQEDVVKTETHEFIENWIRIKKIDPLKEFDIERLIFGLVFSILSRTFLGIPYDPKMQNDFEYMAIHLNRYLIYQFFPFNPKFYKTRKRWNKTIDSIIEERKNNFEDKNDILSTLLKKGSIDDLSRRSLSQAYWAGTFTHSAVILGAIFHLGREPENVKYLLNDEGNALNVAKEALRMYPGAPIYDRGVRKGEEIKTPSGHTFKHKDRPLVCPHIIGTDPKYWAEPLKFNPSRFENHEGFQSKAFVPFGHAPEDGGRACTGRYYALEVIPWVLHTIFKNYDINIKSDKIIFAEYAACAKSSYPVFATIKNKDIKC